MSSVLTVSQINTYIKSILDYDNNLRNVYISGEISNFTNHYRSGHFYFTLKDEKAAVKAVMFRSAASRVKFELENGMKVVVRGSISVYERDGVYQLYAEDIVPDGVGALNLAFEQLKTKLSALGMFDEEHKKPIPAYPEKIGVITSPTGAAIQDITSILSRRYPIAQVIFEPVQVQGDSAAPQIAQAIEKFNRLHACDVLIVGRGGGSIEDLWAFNEEIVANAVYASEIPVISAVGHETDFTICDFVADLRAATPSAAAELAVPDSRELMYSLDRQLDSLTDIMNNRVLAERFKVNSLEKRLSALSPVKTIELYSNKTALYKQKLAHSVSALFERYRSAIASQAVRLDSLSPVKLLSKGYSIASDEMGNTVESVEAVKTGDKLKIRVVDGTISCTVDLTEKISE